MNVLQNTLKLKFLENINNIKMTKNKLKLTLKTVALITITTLTINTASAQLHVTKPDGNVGIGMDTPADKLDVNGNINAGGGIIRTGGKKNSSLQIGKTRSINGKAYFDLYPKKGETYQARFLTNDNGLTHFTHYGTGIFLLQTMKNDSKIVFAHKPASGHTSLCIVPEPDNKTTNVGIGTDAPEERLHVNGNLKVNGNAYKSGGGDWTVLSDKRTKKNINKYTKGLKDVLKLNPVMFNYNGKAGVSDIKTTYIGLIAQEFAEIEPNAISKYTHTDTLTKKTEEYMAMDASSIRYMLVNAVKELQSITELQRAEIVDLKETVAKLATNSSPVSTPGATEISVLLEGTGIENALLAQNTPNPFTTKTRIEYFIPTNSRNARMSFRDMTGKEIKRVELTNDGIGAIELSAKDLAAGIYSYVLYVNGSIVASKKMVLKQ